MVQLSRLRHEASQLIWFCKILVSSDTILTKSPDSSLRQGKSLSEYDWVGMRPQKSHLIWFCKIQVSTSDTILTAPCDKAYLCLNLTELWAWGVTVTNLILQNAGFNCYFWYDFDIRRVALVISDSWLIHGSYIIGRRREIELNLIKIFLNLNFSAWTMILISSMIFISNVIFQICNVTVLGTVSFEFYGSCQAVDSDSWFITL